MKKILLLTKIQLKGSMNIKKIFHMNEGKNTSKIILAILGVFFIVLFSGVSGIYSYLYATILAPLGALEAIPAMWMALICFITLLTTMYKVKGTLFQFSDYDMLMSMPVSTASIVASRILVLYLYNLFVTIILIVPANIVYGVCAKAQVSYYVLSTLLMFFLPLIPILFGTLIGLLITIVSSKFKFSNLISLVLFIGLFAGYMFFMLQTSTKENPEEAFATIANTILNQVYGIYPLTKMYVQATVHVNVVSLLGFIGISVFVFLAFCLLIGKTFKKINTLVAASKSKSNYKMGELKTSGIVRSLYKKEMKRFFSSPMYVLNSAAGIMIMTVASIIFIVFGKEKLVEMFEISGLAENLASYVPILLLFCVGMTCTTAASISLEGKSLWILQSLPINPKNIFLGKALVNISISGTLSIINGIIYGIGLGMKPLQLAITILLPCIASVFMAFMGLVYNIKFPRFDWKNEMEVVKQGIPTLASLLTGMVVGVVPIGAIYLFPQVQIEYLYLAFMAILSIITVWVYKYLATKGSIAFSRL